MYPNITIFPFGVYIVRRPLGERELSADIFPARERSKIADCGGYPRDEVEWNFP